MGNLNSSLQLLERQLQSCQKTKCSLLMADNITGGERPQIVAWVIQTRHQEKR